MRAAKLREALAAVQRGDDTSARAALIAVWRTRRAPELAALVELLDERSPDELSKQIAEIVRPRVATSLDRLEALDSVDDPRLARWAIDSLVDPPFSSRSASLFLHRIVKTADRLADPRLRDRGPQIASALRARVKGLQTRENLIELIDLVIAKIKPLPPTPPDEAELELELARALEPLGKSARSATTLLADIYAHPFDDAPRIVYADVMLERGDKRGELITLQLERGRGGTVSDRERWLLKQHGKEWLGPLAPVLSFGPGYARTRFERGFVSVADIMLSVGKKLALVMEEPSWATVEHLEGSWDWELLRRAPLRALRTIDRTIVGSQIVALSQRAEPLAMDSITISAAGELVDAATMRRAFPSLATVSVFFEQPIARELSRFADYGLKHFYVKRYGIRDETLLAAARAAHDQLLADLVTEQAWVDQLSIDIPGNTRPPPPIVFRRGADGTFERT